MGTFSTAAVIPPKILVSFFLASDQMGVQAIASETRKRSQGVFGPRFDHRGVTEQRHSFEASISIATSVKRSAVVRAQQPVVANQAGHEHSVNHSRGKKFKYLGFVGRAQFTDNAGFI